MAKNDWRFTKQAIKEGSFSSEELKEQYTRFARIKNARITRLEKAYSRAEVLEGVNRAPKYKELLTESGEVDISRLSSELAESYKFDKRETTTVTGYRRQVKRSIKSFNKLFDEDIINEENIFDLYDFLKDYRNKNNVQKIPDSDRLLDVYAESIRLRISPKSLLKDIDYWQEHLSEMEDLEPAEDGDMVNSSYYRSQMNDL